MVYLVGLNKYFRTQLFSQLETSLTHMSLWLVNKQYSSFDLSFRSIQPFALSRLLHLSL